jgi:hypothetical protein
MVRRKPTDQVQLKLRFDERLRRKMEDAAARNDRSLNSEIIARLEQSMMRLGMTAEILSLVYGPKVGGLLAAAHVHGKILFLRPEVKEHIRKTAAAKIDEILKAIPEKRS